MRHRTTGILTWFLVSSGILACSALASGNLIRVKVDRGASAAVAYTTGGMVTSQGAFDTNNDGEIEFSIPKDVESVSICKTSDGRGVYYRIKVNAGGVTLASLGPFHTPPIADTTGATDVVALVAIDDYLAAGSPLASGEALNIVNGAVAGVASITVKDGTSLPVDPELAVQFMLQNGESLPNFSGSGTVEPFDLFCDGTSCVPAASQWGVITMGVVIVFVGTLAGKRRRSGGTVSQAG